MTVEREADTIEVQITWEGGAKTQLPPLQLRRQGQTYRHSTPEDTVELVRRLAAHYDDQTIALVLAKQKRRTTTGLRFTKRRVAQLRNAHGIPAFAPAPAATSADGELLGVRDVAAELDVTPATVYRWLRDGFITGERPTRSESSARPCYITSNAASWQRCTSAAASATAYESRSHQATLDCLTHRDERRRNVHVTRSTHTARAVQLSGRRAVPPVREHRGLS